jgi:3-deoxy-D-manno-octulosonic-acid transferase
MQLLYNILLEIVSFFLPITSIFNHKMKLFVEGRRNVFKQIENKILPNDKVIWIHCASLGEFEQGRPLIENSKSQFPNYKIVLTFFSPSGYEIRKNYELADIVIYLPLDTKPNAEKFIHLTKPELAIFVKYEFWHNYLNVLKRENIPTLLISGIFRKNQLFFNPYFKWYRQQLNAFTHFFVQDANSEKLLNEIGLQNVSISGDTRFDRVSDLLHSRREMKFLENFRSKSVVLIAGSVWQPDLDLLVPFINQNENPNIKMVIAPHNINQYEINKLQKELKVINILQSNVVESIDDEVKVIILDSIGWLSSAYAYCDIAYIGGGFGVGIHNILEAATYGVPIFFGPNYSKFKEANDLIALGCAKCVNNKEELIKNIEIIVKDQTYSDSIGAISKNYVLDHLGATKKILGYIKDVL